MTLILYSTFSLFSFWRAGSVLLASRAVHSVLYLVLTFLNVCALLFILEAEILALLFIVVYIGAIAILFLFVVIMLDLKRYPTLQPKHIYPVLPCVRFIIMTLFGELLLVRNSVILKESQTSEAKILWQDHLDDIRPLEPLGQLLYTHYFFYLVLAGLILLIALVGSIVLTLPNRSKMRIQKRQNVHYQLSRNRQIRKVGNLAFNTRFEKIPSGKTLIK